MQIPKSGPKNRFNQSKTRIQKIRLRYKIQKLSKEKTTISSKLLRHINQKYRYSSSIKKQTYLVIDISAKSGN
jgi:hypothetical protein